MAFFFSSFNQKVAKLIRKKKRHLAAILIPDVGKIDIYTVFLAAVPLRAEVLLAFVDEDPAGASESIRNSSEEQLHRWMSGASPLFPRPSRMTRTREQRFCSSHLCPPPRCTLGAGDFVCGD